MRGGWLPTGDLPQSIGLASSQLRVPGREPGPFAVRLVTVAAWPEFWTFPVVVGVTPAVG